MTEKPFDWGKPISVYTRKQAIDDGTLIEISKELLHLFHIGPPTVITRTVYGILKSTGAYDMALRNLLSDFALKAKTADSDRINLVIDIDGEKETIICHIGPGDTAEPVITLMTSIND